MKRRDFFLKTIKFGSFILLMPSSKLFSKLLFNNSMAEILDPDRGFIKIKLSWVNNIAYAKVKDLAKILETNYFENIQKRKIVLYYLGNRFTVTADNNFVKINGELFQLPYEAIESDGEIFAPIEDFLLHFNRHCKTNIATKLEKQTVPEEKKQQEKSFTNVTNVKIDPRNNGLLIELSLSQAMSGKEVQVEFRNDWLFIDLYKGKISDEVFHGYTPQKPVKDIKIYQHAELGAFALQLEKKRWRREVWVEPEEKQIKIILIDDEYEVKEEVSESGTGESSNKKLEQDRQKWFIDTIVIDPGHGGKDPGAIGYKKMKEKDIVLAIGLQLRTLINKNIPKVDVLMTRDKDVFVPLKDRTHFANKKSGKLFVSIHANSLNKRKVSGFETYFLGPDKGDLAKEIVMKENSVINLEAESAKKEYEGLKFILATMAQNAFMRQSEYLARMVQGELAREMSSLKLKDRGVKQGPFWVMVGASMPNILIETGFISNKHDAKILKTKKYQLKIAQGIFNGIKRYKEDTESAI